MQRAHGGYRPPPRRQPLEVYRRRRLTVVTALMVILGLILYATSGGASSSHKKASPPPTTAAPPPPPAHLEVGLAPWRLPSPLSHTVALAVNGDIDIFGGLTGTGQTTSAAIIQIDPSTGQAQNLANLPVAVHDAAGAAVGSKYYVFGGGAATPSAAAQSLNTQVTQGAPVSALAGQLPNPRADMGAATGPSGTAYLAGGYDGSQLTASVLATSDGSTFSSIGQLTVPVRYPAVAAVGSQLLVVGGDPATGPATDDIQAVDLKTGQSGVVGHLPVTLSHAAAATLDGSVYIFGGRSAGNVVDTVYKLVASSSGVSATAAGALPVPASDMAVAVLGQTAYLVGGEGQLAQPAASVVVARLTTGAGPAPAFDGKLLIADRANNRLLLVNADKRVLWSSPSLSLPGDAFFVKHGTEIIVTQGARQTVEAIAYPSGRLAGVYGHPNVPGSSPGYLDQPDDAYMLNDGEVTVADGKNCRILFLNPTLSYESAIGHAGRCQHDVPNSFANPNGDTPLADGNFLVSESVGSYVDEVTKSGRVVWSLKLPVAYPSDPQQIGPDLYLITDYSTPGQVLEFTREGQIT
ncbi:MAG: hypothetical protein JO337_06695, partial [Acidimicrobiales bacterium]|nr:hypothetical protein [Acidimicrobiales bacterium]